MSLDRDTNTLTISYLRDGKSYVETWLIGAP